MEITLNGDVYILSEELNLFQFLNERVKDIDKIVVEYNYEIVKRKNWERYKLKNGDILEVLRFVGGG